MFHTTFNVFLSPGANPADSRACRAADSSPIMVNFSALAALPSGRGRLLYLTRVDKACLKTLSASEIKSNQSPAKNFWNLVSNFFLGTYPPRHDMRGRRKKSFHPRSCFTSSRWSHPRHDFFQRHAHNCSERRSKRRELFSSSALGSRTPCPTHIHPTTGKRRGWRAGGRRNQLPIPPRAPLELRRLLCQTLLQQNLALTRTVLDFLRGDDCGPGAEFSLSVDALSVQHCHVYDERSANILRIVNQHQTSQQPLNLLGIVEGAWTEGTDNSTWPPVGGSLSCTDWGVPPGD